MSNEPDIRRAGPDEIPTLVEWAAREGWNPGLADAGCFLAADPQGFWIATVDGAPAAGMSLVSYGDGFAFLGFYIVRPELRGRGIGLATWNRALDGCVAATVGLDGVVDQQDNYRKSGFALAHRNVRYGGTVEIGTPDLDGLVAVAGDRVEAVLAYDRAFFPAPRPAFLRAWLSAPGHSALAALDGGRIGGYGVVRLCREGHKIGPLFADDPDTAERLFRALAACAGGAPVFLDPPEPNGPATALCRKYGLAPVFETARMYRGPAPDLPLERIFGITTFELG